MTEKLSEEFKEALVRADDNMPSLEDDREDAVNVPLPGYDQITDREVNKSVKDIFKGFDPSSTTAVFASDDALATYAQNTMNDIMDMRKKADASQMLYRGAMLARFWYLGKTIGNALDNGDYGANVIQKLMASLGKSQSYIYQIRQVAAKIELVDCYLLGMRGIESSDLRKLAYVRDDTLRKQLITSYINAIKDGDDVAKIDKARRELKAALLADRNADAIDVGTSDPNNGGTEIEVTPEWNDAIQTIRKWHKLAKPQADATLCNDSVAALGNFYLSRDTPDAAARLAELKMAAEDTAAALRDAKQNIEQIIVELDSLAGVELS